MAKADSRDDVVSASKASRILGITVQSVVGRIKRGTLKAKKSGRGYAIPRSEIDRLLREQDEALSELTPPSNVPSEGVLTEHEGAHLVRRRPNVEDELLALERERDALSMQAERAEAKVSTTEQLLEAARREQDTLRGTLERSDRDSEHLRNLTTQQADTIQNLSEELKGLTIALHHEQNQRLALEADIKDENEEEETKRGFLRRAFTRKPKRNRQKFARVGPSQV